MPLKCSAGTSRLFRHITLPDTVICTPDLYAKLLSSCEGMLIHPLHVLLNVCIKFFIWSISAPLYHVGVLYAVSWRPASHAPICIRAACKHARIARYLKLLSTALLSADKVCCTYTIVTTCNAALRALLGAAHLSMWHLQHLGVSASVQRGNFTCGGKSHRVHSKQGVKPGMITRACPLKPSVPPSTNGLMVERSGLPSVS